ncbi:MAG: excinuclease ABC subunit C [Methanobacteriota archaeon]|nr:MAG: excinuclease ABC subunit C [Euryarchaeota archaeon]
MLDLNGVPTGPGCYLFKDSGGQVIYVGKARDLRRRVKSYFQKEHEDPKTRQLVERIHSADFIVTDTEVEALILENNLIKRYQPKYNINLKDSKNYAYIEVTDEDYPRLGIARRKTGRGRFYGPFVSAQERDRLLDLLSRTFGLRRCRRMPKKECLRSHLKGCSAPCVGAVERDEYAERVRMAEAVLRGRTEELIDTLKEKMEAAAESLNFEKALTHRDQIQALTGLMEQQKMDRQRRHDEAVIGYALHRGSAHLLLFHVHRGILQDKEEYVFPASPGFLEEFLVQYYAEHTPPKEIILPEEVDGAVAEYLTARRGGRVKLTVPVKGEKKQLLELVNRNVETTFFGDESKVEALQEALGLPEPPGVIECFDISHLSGTSTVGSMVQYRNARPDKSNYRRFRIKTVKGISDTAAISEVVRRRYSRLKREGAPLPDLIVIDGGAGQLGAATSVLGSLGLQIPVIAIAKRFEDIYLPGQTLPLKLPRRSKALQFIREIRDEAHRFAVKYQRLLREKEMKE